MSRIPIMFLSDSIDLSSGLARITRDLITRVHTHLGDKFRVAALGRGGLGGDFPFPTWVIPHNTQGTKSPSEWGAGVLPDVWKHFAGTDRGVVLTIWDIPRLLWLTRPEYMVDCPSKDFLLKPPFEIWSYIPVDGHTPNGTLGAMAKESLRGVMRALAYTKYGADVIDRVLGINATEHLPHGLDPVWHPRDRQECRSQLGWGSDDYCVAVVATNQQRKAWGLAAEVGKLLLQKHGAKYKQVWMVDTEERHWSIPSLIEEFGLGGCTTVATGHSDEWLAKMYGACDVSLGIGAGEGFGFPIAESLACGTPCVHGDYAGGSEFRGLTKVQWSQYWLEGPTNVMRPVYVAERWVRAIGNAQTPPKDFAEEYQWDKLWPRWGEWFVKGWEKLQ
jgi:glycosyltransferase involved in cell wall biosynthesis